MVDMNLRKMLDNNCGGGKSTFGELIKEYRNRQGWTQETLAKKMGFTGKSSISKWETGASSPYDLKTVENLAYVLVLHEEHIVKLTNAWICKLYGR